MGSVITEDNIMRKLIMVSVAALMIVLVTGCSAGIGPRGAGVEVGYSDSNHYSV
jgi:hypothetical protein